MPIDTRASSASAKPDPAPARSGLRLSWPVRRVGEGQRRLFTERLALLLEADVPLHTALRVLRDQTGDPATAQVLGSLQQDVTEGKSFIAALARHPSAFPRTYVNLVAAGEQGGYLHKALTQIVALEERQAALRATLAGALAYPAFLILFSLAVIAFVLVVVFPKFGTLFESIRDQLPMSTLFLMAASDFLRSYWHLSAASCIVAAALAVAWGRSPQGRAAIDHLVLRLPLLRQVLIEAYTARIMRVMSSSLASGVTLLDTLTSCREVVGNGEFQALILRLQTQLADGRGIAAGFRGSPLVPALVGQMIETGEQTGKLALVTGRIAEFYERELTKRVRVLAKAAEPVMLLFMGALVGLIVSSLILPIFKLSKVVH